MVNVFEVTLDDETVKKLDELAESHGIQNDLEFLEIMITETINEAYMIENRIKEYPH